MRKNLKKAIFIALLLVFAIPGLNAQMAVSTAGGHHQEEVYTMSWTLGELAVTTLRAGDIILTQGIHQSTLTVSYAVDDYHDIPQITVYPNPAADLLHISADNGILKEASYSLWDIYGRKLSTGHFTDLPAQTMDLSHYRAGVYLLKISAGNRPVKTFRVVKR